MSGLDHGHQVEIYYGLHGGPPVFIGGGSWEDLEGASAAAERIEAELATVGPTGSVGEGAKAFYRHLGTTAGVNSVTEAALEHYDQIVGEAREAIRAIFDDPDPNITA